MQTNFAQERAQYYADYRLIMNNTLTITGTNSSALILWDVEFSKKEYSVITLTRHYKLEVEVSLEFNRANLLTDYAAKWSEQTIEDTGARKPIIHSETLSLYSSSITEPPAPKGIPGFSLFSLILSLLGTVYSLLKSKLIKMKMKKNELIV